MCIFYKLDIFISNLEFLLSAPIVYFFLNLSINCSHTENIKNLPSISFPKLVVSLQGLPPNQSNYFRLITTASTSKTLFCTMLDAGIRSVVHCGNYGVTSMITDWGLWEPELSGALPDPNSHLLVGLVIVFIFWLGSMDLLCCHIWYHKMAFLFTIY